jgi:hypothetical protein
MLNGLEKSPEKHLPQLERQWTTQGGSSLLNSEHSHCRGVEAMINVDSG